MDDQSRHIVTFLIIAFSTVILIVGVNVWLRNAKLAKVYSIYSSVEYYETTKLIIFDTEGEGYIPHYEHFEGWVKGPLEETYIQRLQIFADIALIVAGVLVFLIVLSLEKQDVRKTLGLFCLLCALIVIAIIVISGLISRYSNESIRTEEKHYDSNEKVPILILDDDQLFEFGVLQNFRISGDTAA